MRSRRLKINFTTIRDTLIVSEMSSNGRGRRERKREKRRRSIVREKGGITTGRISERHDTSHEARVSMICTQGTNLQHMSLERTQPCIRRIGRFGRGRRDDSVNSGRLQIVRAGKCGGKQRMRHNLSGYGRRCLEEERRSQEIHLSVDLCRIKIYSKECL